MDSLVTGLQRLFDYAGLFPPAGLPLGRVLTNYAVYRRRPENWLLGRLVVPLGELGQLPVLAHYADGWPLTVLLKDTGSLVAAAHTLAAFRGRHGSSFRVEAIEVPAADVAAIAAVGEFLPSDLERFVEIPADPDPAPLLEAIAAAGCAAKIRTGGLEPAAFPSVPLLARFIERCHAARVPFKATAGLHHPIRADYSLTGGDGAAAGTMHGFVNLAVAVAMRTALQVDEAGVREILDDGTPASFRFGGRAAAWRQTMVTTTEIAFARTTLLRGIGSCSIDEPVADLKRLGWWAKDDLP